MPDNPTPKWQILKLIFQNILTFNTYTIELKFMIKLVSPQKILVFNVTSFWAQEFSGSLAQSYVGWPSTFSAALNL